jgi:ACS family tartrate transporter-like MFS transporter
MTEPSRQSVIADPPGIISFAEADAEHSYIVGKVGRRLMWYLIALYLVSVLDRGNLGFAAFSMNRELGLSPQMYGIGLGVLFLGYAVFELPSNLILARFGARITLTRIALLFGLVTMSMAFVKGPMSFYMMRALLGVAEAGLTPGIFLFLSFWIPSTFRARYNAIFSYSIPLAYLVASLISGAILRLDGFLGLAGWKWLFLLEGMPAIVLGVFGIFYLTDRPKQAKWLASNEREWLQQRIDNEARLEATHGLSTIGSLLRDPIIALLAFAYIGIFCGNATMFAWLPQILHVNGVPMRYIGWVSAVPPLAGVIGMAVFCHTSDRMKERVYHTFALMLTAAAGYGLVAVSHNVATTLLGFVIANVGIYSSLATFWAIPQTFLPAKVKPAAIAIISSFGALLGGWLAPIFIGRLQAEVHSLAPGFYIVAMIYVLSACCILMAGRRLRLRTGIRITNISSVPV